MIHIEKKTLFGMSTDQRYFYNGMYQISCLNEVLESMINLSMALYFKYHHKTPDEKELWDYYKVFNACLLGFEKINKNLHPLLFNVKIIFPTLTKNSFFKELVHCFYCYIKTGKFDIIKYTNCLLLLSAYQNIISVRMSSFHKLLFKMEKNSKTEIPNKLKAIFAEILILEKQCKSEDEMKGRNSPFSRLFREKIISLLKKNEIWSIKNYGDHKVLRNRRYNTIKKQYERYKRIKIDPEGQLVAYFEKTFWEKIDLDFNIPPEIISTAKLRVLGKSRDNEIKDIIGKINALAKETQLSEFLADFS